MIDFFALIRFKVSLSIVLSTTLGFICTSRFNKIYFFVILSVFLLSSGCSILNQLQELRTDRLMERTKYRPLANYKLNPVKALIIALLCIVLALIILININLNVFSLGLLSIVIYNLIYTPLKIKTPFSILIGAFIGAIPPLIGFLSTSSSINFFIINIAVIYYLWQIPHFWLITELYKNDYKRIRYPFLYEKISKKGYKMIFLLWIISYFLSILHLILIDNILNVSTRYGLYLIMLLMFFLYIMYCNNTKVLYICHNVSLGIITLILIMDKAILLYL